MKFTTKRCEAPLIVPIGAWILDEALRQAQAWKMDRSIEQPLWMSVNLSVRQLADPELITLGPHARQARV